MADKEGLDKITVIETTTAERKQETIDLFHQCEPLLQKGVPLTKAVAEVKNIGHYGFQSMAWYRELREYALSQGYYMRR